jgi:hypothetical protein
MLNKLFCDNLGIFEVIAPLNFALCRGHLKIILSGTMARFINPSRDMRFKPCNIPAAGNAWNIQNTKKEILTN